jgi:hypothetical protein
LEPTAPAAATVPSADAARDRSRTPVDRRSRVSRRLRRKRPAEDRGDEERRRPEPEDRGDGERRDDSEMAAPAEAHQAFWTREDAAVAVSIDLPDSARLKKRACRNFEAFVISEIRKQRVEVSERKLDAGDKERFVAAKGREVKQYVAEAVCDKLPTSFRVPPERRMRMRWVLTWQDDPEAPDGKKAKARIVILGFEDPDLTERPTAAPTASRRGRMCMLQVCAYLGMVVERADAATAFLQGRPIQRDLYCFPVPELAKALDVPIGDAVRLLKSSYGLVDAPWEWYLTVIETLKRLGW